MCAALDLSARFVRFYRAGLLRQEHIAASLPGRAAPFHARQDNASDRVQFQRDYFDEADRAAGHQFKTIRLDKGNPREQPSRYLLGHHGTGTAFPCRHVTDPSTRGLRSMSTHPPPTIGTMTDIVLVMRKPDRLLSR